MYEALSEESFYPSLAVSVSNAFRLESEKAYGKSEKAFGNTIYLIEKPKRVIEKPKRMSENQNSW